MNNNGSKYIPVYDMNEPNGGNQIPVTVSKDTPVFSVYTGKFIGYGPIPRGVVVDAAPGHPNYNKTYHNIQRNRDTNAFMAHGHQMQFHHSHKEHTTQLSTYNPNYAYSLSNNTYGGSNGASASDNNNRSIFSGPIPPSYWDKRRSPFYEGTSVSVLYKFS